MARQRGFVIAGWVVVALVTAVVVGLTGFGWATYHHVVSGITVAQVLGVRPHPADGAQNILIMGLDSRWNVVCGDVWRDPAAGRHDGASMNGADPGIERRSQ